MKKEIESVIKKKIADGTIEKVVSEEFEKCIQNVCNNLFSTYGDIGKVVKKKLEEVILPSVERYDYSKYIPKVDTLLTGIINNTSLTENKAILENFKELMIEPDKKEIKLSELFGEYKKYVAAAVDTAGLDVDYYCLDEPAYEAVTVHMEVERDKYYSVNAEKATINFRCEEDADLNKKLEIRKWKNSPIEGWRVIQTVDISIKSLRYADSFDILKFKLDRANTEIELDTTEDAEDYVTPDTKPELSYS